MTEDVHSADKLSSASTSTVSFLKDKWKETSFLFGVIGVSMFVGFTRALSNAKKKESDGFDKIPAKSVKSAVNLHNEATVLAFRALKWGTFYAISGTALIAFTVWKLFGVSNLQEFRQKAGNMLPRIPKNEVNPGRTEFKNLTDLFQYILDEDELIRTTKQGDNGKNKPESGSEPAKP